MSIKLIYNRNILSTGLILLAVFGITIALIGNIINSIATQMNNTAVVELCRSHNRAIAIVLNKTQNISGLAHEFITTGDSTLLGELYLSLTQESLSDKSYAMILDSRATILYHPDSTLIGTTFGDLAQQSIIHRGGEDGGSEERISVMSEYLEVECERIFYPLKISNKIWVVAITVPQFTINEQISEFHRYTTIIAVLAALLFSVLLAFSQARWRHEYDLRRKAERESEQLQLQQVIEQVNPHFLFNSLNSLYALINSNTTMAREFVLKLSGVYRYVLERQGNILSPLESEIEFTMKYYFLQKIRFEEQIELHLEVEPTMNQYKIPSMSLQTIVENAIKHNKITPQSPLRITICTHDNCLIIENNYTPREQSNDDSMGVGLERIRSIYNYYTGENIAVTHTADIFRCVLPLLKPQA